MDLRVPSGWFFVLLGCILVTLGLLTNYSAPLTTVNLNLYAGLAMEGFGGWLLWLAKRTS